MTREFIFDPLSSEIDRVWAGNASDGTDKFSSYYDYYFSGEDIRIFIDGLFDPQDQLDIASFAFSIRQEKQPVYGFWSYNYDAMLFGTRIVTGEITVFTRHPRRMTHLLEKAAANRAAAANDSRDFPRRTSNSVVSSLTSQPVFNTRDERNIEKYWAYSQLDRGTIGKGMDSKNIFSAHPPFNFVILYGAEEVALSPFSSAMTEDVNISDNLDRMIHSDVNQRSVRVDNPGAGLKTVLQQVSLMSVATGFTPGGQPVAESYQFMARDFYHTSEDLSFIRNVSAVNESNADVDVSGDGRPSSPSTSANTSGGSGRRNVPPNVQ
jgi:hypothetical protein